MITLHGSVDMEAVRILFDSTSVLVQYFEELLGHPILTWLKYDINEILPVK